MPRQHAHTTTLVICGSLVPAVVAGWIFQRIFHHQLAHTGRLPLLIIGFLVVEFVFFSSYILLAYIQRVLDRRRT